MLSTHTPRALRATSRRSFQTAASRSQLSSRSRRPSPQPQSQPHSHSQSCRAYSSAAAPNARLNIPIDYATTPLLAHTARTALNNPELPPSITRGGGVTKRMNLYQAINDAMSTALAEDESVLLFGEDVAFGGVFRCSMNLKDTYGGDRVFNTPLSEQGIVGFAIGLAAEGMRPIAEIQFADYVYPAFDQLVNEAARFRYRDGTNKRHVGGLTTRMPCGAVGHGAMYHSQSPEALFTHIPGLRVVIPRSPIQAKGLLLAAIRCNDPVVFLEPKVLYRAAVEQVPVDAYELPLSKAEVLKSGADITIVSYGQPLYLCMSAIRQAEQDLKGAGKNGHFSVELIDLRTIYPWDKEAVLASVRKTGRCIVVHESMVNAGVGAEVAATIQEDAETFVRLEAPVQRVAGWSTHMPLSFEKFVLPDVATNPTNIDIDINKDTDTDIDTTMPSDASIISAFVADAPPGELSNVVADIESLMGKAVNLDDAYEKYNEEQFVTVQLPGGGAKEIAIVSEWSRLGGGRYFDPSSATSFAFDHKTQKASSAQSHAVEGELVQSILKALGIYAKEHYERPAYGVYALDGERVGVLIASNKYSPQNFWNGRWRARYIYDPASGTVEGSIRVDVHYYEDGNVRLLTDKPQTASAAANGVAVVREIAALEKTYQEELNKKFLALSEGAFKGLRRQLPVTRQKIEWEKVASYRLGQDIGGGGRK